ncbi:MAG: extracellular solute-binding protein [Pseudomonadota bacterium]|nr:extracellular solute-binding protein [Pseudomonadota bacterium]
MNLAACSAVLAQSLAQLAVDESPERVARLKDGALREGEVRLYTSLAPEDVAALAAVFEKKYGVRVKSWRASSETILQRIVAESRAGRSEFDVVETISPELERLSREKLLQRVYSARHADIVAQGVPAHREWASTRMNVFTQAYNTTLVRREDLPKRYEDLLDPKWKGKLGIEAEDALWLGAVATSLGEAATLQLFRDIARTNGLSVRKGHTLLANLVVSGEVPLALTVYNYRIEQFKNKGAPVDWFSIGDAIALPSGIGISNRAPHPQSALLFYEFMLGEGQQILAGRDFIPTSKSIDTPMTRTRIRFVDPAIALDQNDKWLKLYDEIVVKQAR